MKNLFDFDAQATQNLYGGQSATRAAGLPVPGATPGSFAPGASNATADAMLEQVQARTQQLAQTVRRPAAPSQARVGYNPATQEFFSQGRVFKDDLNEGRQAAAAGFFDVDNPDLPEGFVPVFGESAKAKLQKDFESQGMLSDLTRRTGQFVAGAGSTMRDLGLPGAQAVEQYGAGVAARNPSQISTAGDILNKPLTAAGEAVGEAGFDVAKAVATGYAGTKAGAAAGSVFGPGGAALGAILGGATGIFLPTLFETYGSVRREQREQGIEDKTRALGAAAGSAALESALGPEAAVGRLLAKKTGALAARDLLQQGAAKAIGKGVAVGAVVEGPLTEVPQSAIERFGAYKDLTGADALNEYLIGGFKGAVGGAAMSTVTSSIEYRQAANFADNLVRDQQLATNPAAPSAERVAAARRVQDVLRGASDDPQFDQQLQEFRQKLARLENLMVSASTRDALENGTPTSLIQDRTTRLQDGLTQVNTAAPTEYVPEPPPVYGRTPKVQPAQAEGPLEQVETLRADDVQGPLAMTPLQSPESIEGPPEATPMQRFQMEAPAINAAIDSIMNPGPLPTTDPLTPMQQQFAQGPNPPAPVTGGLTPTQQRFVQGPTAFQPANPLAGIDLNLEAPASAPVAAPTVAAPLVQVETRPIPPSPAAPAGVLPAAPAVGASSKKPRVRKPVEPASDAELQRLLDQSMDLEASVESPANMRVPGRASLSTKDLQDVRTALLSPEGTATGISASAQKLADAVRAAAKAYYTYLNAGGNLGRLPRMETKSRAKGQEGKIIPTKFAGLTPAQQRGQLKQKGAEQGKTVDQRLQEVVKAMTALGQAADNNAKNVEAVVRLVKDMVQKKLAIEFDAVADGRMEAEEAGYGSTGGKLDAMLSQLWSAAKYGMFTGGTDQLYVRQQALRDSQEMTAAGTSGTPITRAAEGVTANFGKGETYSGMLGVMTYIEMHGTPFERKLAAGIKDALYNSKYGEPTLKFITSGTPSYDPNTNTISIRKDESVAVTLHESLHAALQWFVYNNPNHEAVKSLKASLKQVVSYKGDLPAKAKAVQDLLKKLVAQKSELDAVLELVSYGNTMVEFRKAMQAMPSKGVPKTFFDAVNNLWQSILSSVKALLGSEQSVAVDVIANTFKLLEAASTAKGADVAKMTKAGGNVLEAAITADNFNEVPQEQLLRRPGAELPSGVDLSNFNKRIVPKAISTEFAFNMIGWPKLAGKLTGATDKVADAIRKDFPSLTRWISYVHARFAVPQDVRAAFDQYKDDRQAGYKLTERLATYVQFQPADKVTALFAYLDGDKSALKDDAATRELADEVKKWRNFYVQELGDDKAREFFARGKFSETMLFASKPEQVAGATFGAKDLSTLLGQKEQFEPSLELDWLEVDANRDPLLEGQFYEVYRVVNGAKQHDGFIARNKFERTGAPAGFYVDQTYLWYHKSKSKDGHKFVANMTAKQALEEKRADDLANALRNTMASLAGNYATKQFGSALVAYGRTNDGTQVVFDDLQELNTKLGIKVPADAVLNASSKMAKAATIKHQYRTPDLWVRLPKNKAYGDLAGKIVSGSVWSAITDMSDRQPVIQIAAVNNTMRWFKKSKTVYNLGTHFTNIATNFTMAMMHDIPMPTVLKAAQLFIDYEVRPNSMSAQDRQLVLAFINSNAMLGDYSSAEVKQALYDAMKSSLDNKSSPSLVGRLEALAKLEKGKAESIKRMVGDKLDRVDQIVTEVYSAEDNVFRLAAFLKRAADLSAMNNGKLSPADLQSAGDYARWAFLDYDIDSKAVRIGRQTVLPFISWTYAIIPVLGRIAVHQPWKIANVLLAYTILEQVMQSIAGDEEDEKLRKVGPEYIRDRMFGFGPYMHVRLPFLGDDKNPVYYRLGDYIPMASLTRGLPNGFMGQEWFPSAVTPTGPFVTTVLAALGGVDPYTGKYLSPPTETMWGKFIDRAQILAGQFVPPYAADWIKVDRLEDIAKGRVDKTENFAAMQMARWAGLKLYDFNEGESALAQSRAAKAIMAEYQKEINRLKRAEARYENPDWEGFVEKQKELHARMLEEMAKAKGEE